jgi:hypothetical protein
MARPYSQELSGSRSVEDGSGDREEEEEMSKSHRHYAISVLIAVSIPLVVSAAQAQVLSPTDARCAGPPEYGGYLPQENARHRMAWALECRKRYECAGSTWGPRVLTDDSLYGDTTDPNFQGWAELDATSKQRVWPLYYSSLNGNYWSAPEPAVYPMASWESYTCTNLTVALTSCDAFKTQYSTYGMRNSGLCWSGCYTPEMQISYASGDMGIKLAYDSGKLDLITLTPDATLDNLQYMENKLKSYTVDVEEQRQVIYSFDMESGGTLRVTSEHPLLTDDGIMRQAQDLTKGQRLIKKDGTSDVISSLQKEQYFGKVYNVKPVTYDYQSNIVVAQGYLSGSSRYQNEYLDMINSVILRRALSEEVFQDPAK